jgi:3-hydroxyisobutyrate dehydrogenase-like beta-hydroxyacid dehydrogenase
MSRVAFIGIGTMGRHMAGHLVAAGHDVVACDVDAGRAASVGTRIASSVLDAARSAEVVILSLPSPAIVEEAAREAALALEPGATLIDMSTSPVSLARRLGAELETKAIEFLDAPVSGGPTGAEQATLAIMVGGKPEVFGRWRPLLSHLGGRVEHVGGHGAGQCVKLCNNLIVGATLAAIVEACDLLVREGIDPAQAYEVFMSSTSDSTVMRRRFPLPGVRPEHPASGGYEAAFRLDLLRKDLGLALELARELGVAAPVTETVAAEYDHALAAGLGARDYSALYLARRD